MKPPQPKPVVCAECGAENQPNDAQCWLCYRPLIMMATLVTEDNPYISVPRREQSSGVLEVIALIAMVLVVLVGVGAFASDQGLGIAYCVVVMPAVAIGGITFAIKQGRRDDQAVASGLKSFLMTLVGTVAIISTLMAIMVMVVVASIVAAIAACFSALGGMGP